MNHQMNESNPEERPAGKRQSARSVISGIKRRTRKLYSSEEKIQIVLECLRGEDSVSSICRKYGINENNYYNWSKEFLEAGKKRLSGDTQREATSSEVGSLKKENSQLKELVAELLMQNNALKKSLNGME